MLDSYHSLLLVAVVALVYGVCEISAQTNATYAVLGPKTLRVGSTYDVTVTLFKAASPVTFDVWLQDTMSDARLSSASVTLSVGTHANTTQLSVKIPEVVPLSGYYLYAQGSGGLNFTKYDFISVSRKTLSLFVQTDKAQYKPGQKVLLRAVVLYPNLRPYKGNMNVTIFDSAKNKIVQWLNVNNATGVVSRELQLSDQVNLGSWTIEVKAMDNVFKKQITIAEYVLPKFQVITTLPPYYFVNLNQRNLQKDLPIVITAKYTYGEPVKGRANITVEVTQRYYYNKRLYKVKVLDLELINGTARASVTAAELSSGVFPLPWEGPTDKMTSLSGYEIQVSASVSEAATDTVLSAKNVTITCVNQRHKLKFLDITPKYFKRSLRYQGYLRLSQIDDSPPLQDEIRDTTTGRYSNVTVTMRVLATEYYNMFVDYKEFTVELTDHGYMSFDVTLNDTTAKYIDVKATYVERTSNTSLSSYTDISKFQSRDNEEIDVQMSGSHDAIEPNTDVIFNVKTTSNVTTYFYQILNKGKIVVSKSVVEPRPMKDHSFNLFVNASLAQAISPSANIVVWYLSDNGEMISASLKVSCNGAFANNVSLSFDETTVAPSDSVNLTVNARSGSFVGLLAVDQSVRLLQTGNDLTPDLVSEDLNRYSSEYGYGYYPYGVPGVQRRKRSSVGYGGWSPYIGGGGDTSKLLQSAGLFVLTDAYIYQGYYGYYGPQYGTGVPGMMGPVNAQGPMGPAGAPGSLGVQGPAGQPGVAGAPGGNSQPPMPVGPETDIGSNVEPSRVRADFRETWIWTDAIVGPNGAITVTAQVPDTITSWSASAFAISDEHGLGMPPTPSTLTVFQPFFISMNLPYSVIRGEEFALKVTIFNYMPTTLRVTVTLQKSIDFKVRRPNDIEPQSINAATIIEVPSNDAVSAHYWVVPEALGDIPIKIKAQTPLAADAMERTLLVKPEGVQQGYSTTVLIQLPGNGSIYDSTLTVSLPPAGTLVPGSQHLECTVIGDILGPSIQNLDSLLQMPYGCGEQNMLNLAPDVSIMRYLNVSGRLTRAISDKATGFMIAGYQKELTYQRKDGSFSAFGNSDKSGSTWLSAFVAKVFHQAEEYIHVEDIILAPTLNWILDQQAANGSFKEPGAVLNTAMQGGSANGVPLTAYVLIALHENKDNSAMLSSSFDKAIKSATSFLEEQLSSVSSDPYTLSIVTYALTIVGSSKADLALEALKKLAIQKDGTTHWEKSNQDTADKGDSLGFLWWRPPYSRAMEVNIEMTSYALLTFAYKHDVTTSLSIAKWLIAQQNSRGGFASTQDTVMALEALASLATLISGPNDEQNVTVSVIAQLAGAKPKQFETVTSENALILQTYEVPATASSLTITASGRGTALVQLNVKYNVYSVQNDNGIKLELNTKTDGKKITVRACGSWLRETESGMVVLELFQLSGYSFINLDTIKNQTNGTVMRIESDEQKLVLYYNELTKTPVCVDILSEKTLIVDKVQKAVAKIYQYYNSKAASTILYEPTTSGPQPTYCQSCPQCCLQQESLSSTTESSTTHSSAK